MSGGIGRFGNMPEGFAPKWLTALASELPSPDTFCFNSISCILGLSPSSEHPPVSDWVFWGGASGVGGGSLGRAQSWCSGAGRCSNPSPILLQPSGRGVRFPEVFCIISCLGCFGLFSKVGMWWLCLARWWPIPLPAQLSQLTFFSARSWTRWRRGARSPWR